METPQWVWYLISGLAGAMLGWGIAEELGIRAFRRYIKEQTERDIKDIERRRVQ